MKQKNTLGVALVIAVVCVYGWTATKPTSRSNETDTSVKIITAEKKPVVAPIYFNAFVEPLAVVKVTAPVDGTIDGIHFGYGEAVKKDQVLVGVTSESLERDYHDKLFKYLKAKQEYQTDKTAWQNTQELNRYGLVSKNDIEASKNSLADSTLGVVQAKQDLQSVLETLEIDNFDFEYLDIQDTEEAVKQLSKRVNHIQIKAPNDGIALLPTLSGKDQDKLTLGGPVSKNDILLVVGDMSGITLNIHVNETQIQQLQPEQSVDISFIAQPDIVVKGKVAHIDTQAQSNNQDNPTFLVQVKVPSIKEEEKQYILVGMSAKLKIIQDGKVAVMIPLAAVYEKSGKHMVDVIKDGSEQAQPTEVQTGVTNLNEVVITQGIAPGDKIEIRNRAESYF